MALRTSNLFAKFLLPAVNSPSVARSFASAAKKNKNKNYYVQKSDKHPSNLKESDKHPSNLNESHKHPITVMANPQNTEMDNPFQLRGPGSVIEVDELKNNGGTLVRVAMPGVGDDYRVWAERSTVFFIGKGEIEFEEEECGRHYGGCLEFSEEMYKPNEVKAEMKNGILRLLVPNADKD